MEDTARRRDAGRTRRRLLDAARERFAADGFSSTTVRQVADDAGVDVALIKRYFGSKEGLFEACLAAAVDDLREQPTPEGADDVATRIAHRLLGPFDAAPGEQGRSGSQALLLLLRSSGDAGVDDLRRRVLHHHSEALAHRLREQSRTRGARGAGLASTGDEPLSEAELLQAQVALAAVVGVAVLRSSPGLEPLRSASPDQLAGVLRALLGAAPV
ncbi:TetR/AcrR family transcriptional regulator [Quadrisphaera setariae]|uniref:TetR/AcrR family transcriptional regulator n=1 Tax=Quadrisphaera setariae TaxID=2593304 RepID=UPI001C9D0804|nr:TetR/AcrR family transcriptional regulator [Quadrisphaera setariae]